MQSPYEIADLGGARRPRANGRDLPGIKKRFENSRFGREGHNLALDLVIQFSSGL
jgi:hypothetical protein